MKHYRKSIAVLLGVLLLVGWHHSTGHTRSGSDLGPATSRPLLPPNILSGAGPVGGRTFSPTTSFRLVTSESYGRLASLDSAQLLTLLKLNRVDLSHVRRGSLIVPDSIGEELSYAPFPGRLSSLDSVPKFILVSRSVQAFGAYEHGRLVRWGPTSTGKQETPTDSGLFFTNWKSRQAISTEDSTWVLKWYFNIVSATGIAFHEYDLPGRPASHGCVRLLEDDARWLFGWADQWELSPRTGARRPVTYGTPVVVMGEYAYGHPVPWFSLAEDAGAARVSATDVDRVLAGYLPTILERTAPPLAPVAPDWYLTTGSFAFDR